MHNRAKSFCSCPAELPRAVTVGRSITLGLCHHGHVEIRPIRLEDVPFLLEMTLLAAFPPGPLPEGAAEMPRVTKWTGDWGRPGDIGVVAWLCGEPVGAAWCRVFERSVACDETGRPIPEIAIAVVAAQRSRGTGSELLRALARLATEAGHRRLCLTVNELNPARRLYEREGFRELRRDGSTLVLSTSLSR